MTELDPDPVDTLSGSVNLSRFGATAFTRVYELETPAATDFSFTVIARGLENMGPTRLSLGHVADGGVAPTIGVDSLAAAGLLLDGSGLSNEGPVLDATGDGFCRITLRGQISADQVLLVRVPRAGATDLIGIRIRIGNSSVINLPNQAALPSRPGLTSTTIYSSQSYHFGLPAIAVSGDRYSVVTYDGDPGVQGYGERRRRWLQMDAQTGTVTGGTASSVARDTGNWRDQEIAALGNVLAVVYTGNNEVRADISLDRGATFAIQRKLNTGVAHGMRLVQIAISGDYRIACVFWGAAKTQWGTKLMLVEATPTAFDATNTPAGYDWAASELVHGTGFDVVPLIMQAEYSTGGDLVIGYGYSFWSGAGSVVTLTSRYRCAMRLWGQTAFSDTQVDTVSGSMPNDPHIALLGSGASMEIFYTWDKDDGVHLAHSTDAGQTFTTVHSVSNPGSLMPSVHARIVGTDKRVDMLYLSPTPWGLELHNARWLNFTPATAPVAYAVTTATATPGAPAPDPSLPGGSWITMTAWFGYDAVVKGDQVAVVIHEVTVDSYEYYRQRGMFTCAGIARAGGGSGGSGGGGSYTPPPPAILLPGMGQPVPAPDPTHRSQLRIVVLD